MLFCCLLQMVKPNEIKQCKLDCTVNIADCWRCLHPGRTRCRGAATTTGHRVFGQGQAWPGTGPGLPRPHSNPFALRCRTNHRSSCAIDFACTAHFPRTTHCAPSGVVGLLSPAHLPLHPSFLSSR